MHTDVTSLPNDPDQLKALLLQLQQQHAQEVEQYETTLDEQRRTIAQQEHRITQLLRRIYGPRQEHVDPNQLLLFSAEELEALTRELEAAAQEQASDPSGPECRTNKRRPKRRGEFPANAQREQRVHELPLEQRAVRAAARSVKSSLVTRATSSIWSRPN